MYFLIISIDDECLTNTSSSSNYNNGNNEIMVTGFSKEN